MTGAELSPVPYDQHEREMLRLIGDRDHLEDMADRLAAAIAPAEVLGEHSSDNNPWLNALDYAEANGTHPDTPSRPVPVAGQAAREAAVEAVARWLLREVWPLRSNLWLSPQRSAAAGEVVDIVVAALSAAPGQEPLVEWRCPSCGATTRARMADHLGQEQGR